SVASSFRLGIASCGGTIDYTSPVAIALSPFQDCYCTPVSSGGTGTMINQVDVNTTFTNNSSATNPVASPYYTNYSTLPGTPAVAPGVVMNLALTLEPAGTYTNNIVSVWIDYNHSGTYEATEWTQFGTAVPSGATTTVGIAIPTTALPGNTGMRIRTRGAGNVNGATDACTFLGSGETEDYFINILGPCDPAVFTPPLASADDPDATVCGTQTSQLTAFDFNGSANPIYMWYDAATGGNLLQNSTSNFFTPAPITTTTTWYVATNTGTCITDRFPVTLNWVAPESITLTNSNPSSCGTTSTATDLAVTSANSGYAYTWTATPSAGSGITSGTTGASISGVTPTINGVYVYTASAVDAVSGCTTTATTTVGFYSPLTGTATVTQPLVCGGDGSVNFSVTGSGTVFASDFSSATLNPAQAELCNDAVITGDKLQFTGPVNSQQGGILITNTTGVATNDFQIDFDMITTAGTTPPADGFSYSYGPDVVCMPTPVGAIVDNTVVGVGAANPENGSGSGIRLSFDAYTNGVNVNGIYLMYNCPRINPSSTLTPAEGLYYYDNNTSWIGGANTHVTITIDADGQLSMWLAGTQVLNNAQLPANYITADKSTWKHAFAARTGGLNQGHSIDNLDIHYNNFYEYSVDNGATWTTTSPVAVPAPSTVQNLARYVTTPSCSVDLGTATVEYQVAAPTNVTGGSACLNGNTLNVSANGAPINGVQTLTVPLGTNVNLPGAAVSYSLPYGQVTLNGNVSIPAGATITGANLVVNGLTANGFTWLSDLEVSLSGVSTIANQVFVAAPAGQTSPTNGGPYTIAASIPTGSGAVTCTFLNTYTGNVTMTSVNLVITYTLPSVPVWFDAATGGSVIGTGSTFNVIGTSYLPNASAPFTGNVYAASVVTNGASTCYSATVSAPVTVGQPLTVSIGASAPVTQTFSLATNYSVDAGATQTLTGSITIPAGAVVSSTVLRLNGVTTTGFTYGADVDVAMSGASNVANQSVANVFAEVTNGGPYTYTGSNIVAPGGDVFVTFTHNYSFGGPMDIASVEVLVTYEAPVTGSVCPGTPVTLTATTTGGGSNPTYQWNLNGTPIDGATSTSYVATPALASDAYTATVVDDCNPSGITSSGFSVNLFTATAGTITGPAAILVNDFTAPIPGAGTWNISGQNSGSTIQWSYGTVSTGPYITIAGGVDADQTLYASGAAGTIYLTATTTTTDGCSIQANVVEVVLGNAIDTPCTAAPLTFGNQDGVEWSSAAASAQTGETYGDGNPDPGNTIWFSFVAPASGHVSIESTSSIFWDNYMTLFSGSDCTDPAGMTQLGFNDDANGTAQAALMDVTCLIPGTTYYVQMRGFANFIGQAGITLTDLGNIAPAITGLSSNITASAATATCAATVTWAEPIASDDQGQGCVTLTSDIASGASFNVGTTTVTYTATDAQGLVTTASFTVTVNDTQLPTITAPADVQVTSALNTCTATATLGSATTADNCGVATTTNNAPATFPVGTTTVVWTVTDVNGNVATANQIVTVVPDPTNLWYVDADGDNYGVAGASVVACSQPAGYAANTTDCNDANVNVNPGAIEICGNAIDDNCSGTPEEGCTNPGENPSNATSMSTSIWPNCNAVNGTLVNATVSGAAQTVCLTGEDKWHQFVAT
ncbi:MAG: HYR domain-containing protein, partial [Flavobacteriales bacterium]|nr:HYR domain-containing protein [Flavobacteriales bacterium]